MITENTFAWACVEQNTINDLRDALKQDTPDQSDMDAWNIDGDEWRSEIESALHELLTANDYCNQNDTEI